MNKDRYIRWARIRKEETYLKLYVYKINASNDNIEL